MAVIWTQPRCCRETLSPTHSALNSPQGTWLRNPGRDAYRAAELDLCYWTTVGSGNLVSHLFNYECISSANSLVSLGPYNFLLEEDFPG